MAVDSYSATDGHPIFLDTGAPDLAVDPTKVAEYAADVGNRILRADLATLNAYAYKRKGLRGVALDTLTEYVHDGTAWVVPRPFASAVGEAAIAATGTTTITFPAGRFTLPPIIQVTIVAQPSGVVSVHWVSPAPTATSFGCRIFTLAGAQVAGTVHWEAVQMTSGAAAG